MTDNTIFKMAKSVVPPPISIKATPASFLLDLKHPKKLAVLMLILIIQFQNSEYISYILIDAACPTTT
jgi:hypothetical protein